MRFIVVSDIYSPLWTLFSPVYFWYVVLFQKCFFSSSWDSQHTQDCSIISVSCRADSRVMSKWIRGYSSIFNAGLSSLHHHCGPRSEFLQPFFCFRSSLSFYRIMRKVSFYSSYTLLAFFLRCRLKISLWTWEVFPFRLGKYGAYGDSLFAISSAYL